VSQPPRSVTDQVDARDAQRCVKCGRPLAGGSRHHRQLRSQGGKHTVQNLVLMCGSGTTGCHGWTHAHPVVAADMGWIVLSWEEPDEKPMLTWRGWVLLTADGGMRLLDRPLHDATTGGTL